jgi:hypothetical protein
VIVHPRLGTTLSVPQAAQCRYLFGKVAVAAAAAGAGGMMAFDLEGLVLPTRLSESGQLQLRVTDPTGQRRVEVVHVLDSRVVKSKSGSWIIAGWPIWI